jgi:GT2 family glycosyltransferase
MTKKKVGIVMLSYNRADIVVPCVESLVKANTNIDFELYLLDNASNQEEYLKIKKEFDLLNRSEKIFGKFVRSEVNHGYPKGNNLGIAYFLNNPEITHICLLNSDVIVTDFWLDRLVDSGFDAVGPVTNACGNEQTIPIPFTLRSEDVSNFSIVNKFSAERRLLFKGASVQTDWLGFFCFMAKRKLFQDVGMLDERFGRGGFEDDDYCIRILSAGYKMNIVRDSYVYHWGTASFIQIPLPTLMKHIAGNRMIFEKKYGKAWVDRKWLPLKGFSQDMNFLLLKYSNTETREIFSLYYENVEILAKNIANAEKENASKKISLFGNVFKFMNNFSLVRKTYKGIRLLFATKSILFLVRFPNNEDLKDGYFQRINAIDTFLSEYNRFYVNYLFELEEFSLFPKVVKIKNKVFEIRPYIKNPLHLFVVLFLDIFIGRIYLHSILRLQSKFNKVLFFVSRKRILDIHGVVPEEFEMHGDIDGYNIFNNVEKFAIGKADVVIGVTGKMVEHIIKKHKVSDKKNMIILPILPEMKGISENIMQKKINTVIYCGGLQKWQQVEKMLEYVELNKHKNEFAFLVPEPQKLLDQYKNIYKDVFPGIVESVESHKVNEWYARYSFGLVLREDIIVNNAACPTKLIEYFQNDVVPIVDSANIGDFRELGYAYVDYKKELPTLEEWKKMVIQNREVLKEIYSIFEKGSGELMNKI